MIVSGKDLCSGLSVGVICGGPSLERGISLNSARSVVNHLGGGDIGVQPFYVDRFMNFYRISPAQLYSNTPSDFDFKLSHEADQLSEEELIRNLKKLDIVFPAIHGAYGEDGGLQALLERHNIPFVGSGSACCKAMFYKHSAAAVLEKNGFQTIPSRLLNQGDDANERLVTRFFEEHNLDRAVVKPVAGGSSIGVSSVQSPREALVKLDEIFAKKIGAQALIEPFCVGREFTVIVLQNRQDAPVALVPTEISISYENDQIFDYRRKYLPTGNTQWFCPPRFADAVTGEIRALAEEIFTLFGMRDFARLDGWLLDDGRIVFTDLNPISGMEQNSFIFQQSSRAGLTHRSLLRAVVRHACARTGLKVGDELPAEKEHESERREVRVLFGGDTAERHVSVMSGTNVWLKLSRSDLYEPLPYFLDQDGYVWEVPYTYALNHTTEEIHENCLGARDNAARLTPMVADIRGRLGLDSGLDSGVDGQGFDIWQTVPRKMTFDHFLQDTKQAEAFLFLGLHGGAGEDGTFQLQLDAYGIPYNGSGPDASRLCMDKHETGRAVSAMNDPMINTAPKKPVRISDFDGFSAQDWTAFWNALAAELGADSFIVKPREDGCSAGIVRLYSVSDLERYIGFVRKGAVEIPPGSFRNQTDIIEMSVGGGEAYLIETFIETDAIDICGNELRYQRKTGWLELTVGVLERAGRYHALNPSITVAEGEVLSLEEKFQGGTGINITPPPPEISPESMRNGIKAAIEKTACALGIENYARIDIFYNVITGEMIVIEVNTLPGLTPSTVIYHQALAENPPLEPVAFLETIISSKTAKQCPTKENKEKEKTSLEKGALKRRSA